MAKVPISIEELNKLPCIEFTRTFKNIVENYGTAALLLSSGTFHNVMDMYSAICNILDRTDTYRRQKILQDHPGLKSCLSEITDMSHEEKLRLAQLIRVYEDRFGFSFVICEKENKADDIMKVINQRIRNTKNMEVRNGIEELKKISKYRVLQIIKHEYA